jgi:hypothetical protein
VLRARHGGAGFPSRLEERELYHGRDRQPFLASSLSSVAVSFIHPDFTPSVWLVLSCVCFEQQSFIHNIRCSSIYFFLTMLFQSILAVVAVLPAVFASPVVQGVAEREAEARSMMERAIEARQAYGSGYINTTAGLKWYTPDHTVGNDGRPDPAAYMCYSGPASVWPQNNCSWVNFNKVHSICSLQFTPTIIILL